jgi:hypothetical protein
MAAAIPVVGSRLRLIPTVAGRLGTALGRGIESTDRHSCHRLRQAIAVFSRADQGSRPHALFQTAKSWRGDSDAAGDLLQARIMPVSFVSSMGSARSCASTASNSDDRHEAAPSASQCRAAFALFGAIGVERGWRSRRAPASPAALCARRRTLRARPRSRSPPRRAPA